MTTKPKIDLYQHVTDTIITAIESGRAKADGWEMPWHRAGLAPMNAQSGKFYRGVNVPLVWAEMVRHEWDKPYFATYKQWAELGAQVRKGEKSIKVVFWKISDVVDKDGRPVYDERGRQKKSVLARGYNVFNCDQVDGWTAPEITRTDQTKRIALADRFIAASGAAIRHADEGRAYYSPGRDAITMPRTECFHDTRHGTAAEHYYSTLLHELTHWTGHKARCDRDMSGRFGNASYAAEELVAELGAAFMCHALGISPTPRDDHAEYVANWLQVLRNDKKAIFTASSKAAKAVDWLEAKYRAAGETAETPVAEPIAEAPEPVGDPLPVPAPAPVVTPPPSAEQQRRADEAVALPAYDLSRPEDRAAVEHMADLKVSAKRIERMQELAKRPDILPAGQADREAA